MNDMTYKLDQSCALIVVDMQNDFMPSGSLPVPESDEIVPVLNKYIDKFASKKLPIFATRDWHPPNHKSFKQRGGVWPMHCVKDTYGAHFHEDLKFPRSTRIISKGYESDRDAYSGFEGTELADRLEENQVKRVLIGGVATDYCVKNTAIDALNMGLEVVLLKDAMKGIKNEEETIKELQRKGAKLATLDEVTV